MIANTMISEIAGFGDGRRESLTGLPLGQLPSTIDRLAKLGGFVWISLDDPDAAELESLGALLGLHPLAVADAASGRQQPKIQSYEEHLFVVLWMLIRPADSDEVTIAPTFLFVRDGLLVSVRRGGGAGQHDFSAMLDAAFAELGHGAVGALYAIMHGIVEGYTEVTDLMESDLETLETQVFAEETTENVRQIYRMRQQIGRVQRAISGMSVSLGVSREHLRDLIVGHERVEPYFQDLIDDLVGTNQLIGDQDRALDGVLASHENNVAVRQNNDTRKISAFAALLSVPAVLAGLFGMNFTNLPGVSWAFGWEVLVAVIVVIDVVMYVMFKRRRWL